MRNNVFLIAGMVTVIMGNSLYANHYAEASNKASQVSTVTENWDSSAAMQFRPLVEWPTDRSNIEEKYKITILGEATVPQEQMVAYIRSRGVEPKLNCTLEELVAIYYAEGAAEGIRGDIAICQALKETGFFQYGNDVHYTQNNYCGLGATGNGAPGYSFFLPERGVRAHIQHLQAYACTYRPKQALVDPRYDILVKAYPQYHGDAIYWTDLNGRWAVPGTHYGQDILNLWYEAKNFNNNGNDNSSADDILAKVELNKKLKTQKSALTELLEKKAANDKNTVEYLLKEADTFREWGSKGKEALASYKKVLEIEPGNIKALLGTGQQLYFDKDLKGSKACYDRILADNPNDVLALYNRGGILMDLGDIKAGMQDLKKALSLEPDNKIIKNRIEGKYFAK